MKFTELIEVLQAAYSITAYQNYYDNALREVRFVTKAQDVFEDDVLYLATQSMLPDSDSLEYVNIVIADMPALTHSPVSFYKCNLVLVHDRGADFMALFNFVHGQFNQHNDILRDVNALLQADVVHHNNLGYLTKLCGKMLDTPLFIVDKSFRLIEHFLPNANAAAHPVWRELLEQKALPGEMIAALLKIPGMRNVMTADPFLFALGAEKTQVMVCKVINGHEDSGFVFCCEGASPFGKKHNRLLPVFSHVVSDLYTRNNIALDLGPKEHFLHEMLVKSPRNTHDLVERLRAFSAPAQTRFLILVIDFSNTRLRESDLGNMGVWSNFFTGSIPQATRIFLNWNLVILAEADTVVDEGGRFREVLVDFARARQLSVGVSEPFANLIDLPGYYDQAMASISLSQKLGHGPGLHGYNTLRFYHILEQVPPKENLAQFANQAVAALTRYDEENRTQLCPTLAAFVQNGCSMQKTAAGLFLHRNTLAYRIKKIEDLTGLDLQNDDTVFDLNCTFRILEYLRARL